MTIMTLDDKSMTLEDDNNDTWWQIDDKQMMTLNRVASMTLKNDTFQWHNDAVLTLDEMMTNLSTL